MSRIKLGKPVVIAQSTTEPIFKGGYQDTFLRCDEQKNLYLRFAKRHDSMATFGQDDHPLYISRDGGETWAESDDLSLWVKAQPVLPNGDRFQFREHYAILKDIPPLPRCDRRVKANGFCVNEAYTVEDLEPLFGDRVAKTFRVARVYAGTDKVVEEEATVRWDNMPITAKKDVIVRPFPMKNYVVDKQGVMWTTVFGNYILPDGTLGSDYWCSHLLRSDDFGHSWDYVSTLPYREEYQNPNCHYLEGFNETSLLVLENGSLLALVRSGSLFVDGMGDPDHPAPQLFYSFITDNGKTWSEPKPFYEYGVWPESVRLGCGTILMTSGRPGVYIRATDDPTAQSWDDVIQILPVPPEDYYTHYHEYSCSNNGIAAYDDHTAFISYSNFKIPSPEGKVAKSIVVQRITVE